MADRASLIEPAYDLETGEEIVDRVTVDILVQGYRKVASTTSERIAAVHRIIRRGDGVRAVANNIGISIQDAKELLSQAGYEIVSDPMYRKADGSDGNRFLVTKVAA